MRVFPVIHYLDHATALEQVATAKTCGASGVFLTSHHGDDDQLMATAKEAKRLHPEFAIGVNLLSRSALTAVHLAHKAGLNMVWADNMGVDSSGLNNAGKMLSIFARQHPEIALFASVAFKHQPNDSEPETAARNALAAGFIPTTSGVATGTAPTVSKIFRMYSVVRGTLAIASGMTPENVGSFAPHLSHILVATEVSLDEHHIDPEKLSAFIINASRKAPKPPHA